MNYELWTKYWVGLCYICADDPFIDFLAFAVPLTLALLYQAVRKVSPYA